MKMIFIGIFLFLLGIVIYKSGGIAGAMFATFLCFAGVVVTGLGIVDNPKK